MSVCDKLDLGLAHMQRMFVRVGFKSLWPIIFYHNFLFYKQRFSNLNPRQNCGKIQNLKSRSILSIAHMYYNYLKSTLSAELDVSMEKMRVLFATNLN